MTSNSFLQNKYLGLKQAYGEGGGEAFHHYDKPFLTESDTHNNQKMDALYLVLRLRKHVQDGHSHDEAMKKIYQEMVTKSEGFRVERYSLSDFVGDATKVITKCTDGSIDCAGIAKKVYNTGKCLKSGGGVKGAYTVATGGDCPAGSTKVADDAVKPVDTVKPVAVTCSTVSDTAGKAYYYTKGTGQFSSYDLPATWDPPVACACYENPKTGKSWTPGSAAWIDGFCK